MRDTNGERVSLNDAAGAGSLLLESVQDAKGADQADRGDLRDLANCIRHAKDAVAAARPEAGPALPGTGSTQENIDALFD